MTASAPLDFSSLLAPDLPPPAAKWNGFAKYNFIGGHNDADQLPLETLIKAANDVLTREGCTLATYGLASGPLGALAITRRLVVPLPYDIERTSNRSRWRCAASFCSRCRQLPHSIPSRNWLLTPKKIPASS